LLIGIRLLIGVGLGIGLLIGQRLLLIGVGAVGIVGQIIDRAG